MFKPRIKKLEGELEYLGYIRALLASKVTGFKDLRKEESDEFAYTLIADCLCDKDGNLTTSKDEVEAEIDILTTQELVNVIFEFNKLSKEPGSKEAKDDLKNARKP